MAGGQPPYNTAPYMLDTVRSRIGAKYELPLASSAAFTQDLLVAQRSSTAAPDGGSLVEPFDNSSKEVLGMVQVDKPSAVYVPVAGETAQVPSVAPFVIQLAYTNIVVGSVSIYNKTTAAYLVPPGNFTFVPATGVITLLGGFSADDELVIAYRYEPTMAEVLSLFGESFDFRNASDIFQQVPILAGKCEIYTLQYDTASEWALNTAVKITAGAILTQTGTGWTWADAQIIKLPTAGDPFLGVAYDTNY